MIIIDKTDVREAKKMGETYGWLFRGGVNNAGKRLSYESFKWYVDLALNQDGYHCKDQIPDDVADELYKYGYLAFSRGETHFNEWGNDVTATNAGVDHNYQSSTRPEQQRVEYSPSVPEYQAPTHYEPPATYENPEYSDMFVHVGADGRVQDEPESEYIYTSDDLPF